LFDAARQGHSARRRRHRVRRHARRLRRTAIGDEGIDPRAARAPLDRLLATDAGLRLLEGRGGRAHGRRPSARSHHSTLGPARGLPGITRLTHHRLAGPRGTASAARPHRARDPAPVRLSPQLARRRPRDLGQPLHDAPRDAVRGREAPARASARDDLGYGGPRNGPPYPPAFGAPRQSRIAPLKNTRAFGAPRQSRIAPLKNTRAFGAPRQSRIAPLKNTRAFGAPRQSRVAPLKNARAFGAPRQSRVAPLKNARAFGAPRQSRIAPLKNTRAFGAPRQSRVAPLKNARAFG